MYLLYAPKEKFKLLPPATALITDEVKFYQNVAFCPKFYWKKFHTQAGCKDITPRYFKKLRLQRNLRTVAIFATGGLGDSLWCMPIAMALKEKHPQAVIMIITERKNAGLWQNVPYINAVVENAFWNVTGIVKGSDEVYDFGGVATIFKKQMRLDPIEAIFQVAQLPLPKEKAKCRPMLTVTIDEGKRGEAFLKQKGIDTQFDTIVSISIESSTPNRNWPIAYLKELSQALINDSYKVIWLGKTKEYSDKFLKDNEKVDGVVNLVDNTNIRQAMAIITLSDLFVGPNSGLMVIAASLLTPTVGLFGAFNPKLRAKFYERFLSLWGRVECAPCNEHWTECRHGHPAPCMKKILPSEVYKAVKEMLKRWPRSLIEKLPID